MGFACLGKFPPARSDTPVTGGGSPEYLLSPGKHNYLTNFIPNFFRQVSPSYFTIQSDQNPPLAIFNLFTSNLLTILQVLIWEFVRSKGRPIGHFLHLFFHQKALRSCLEVFVGKSHMPSIISETSKMTICLLSKYMEIGSFPCLLWEKHCWTLVWRKWTLSKSGLPIETSLRCQLFDLSWEHHSFFVLPASTRLMWFVSHTCSLVLRQRQFWAAR